LQDVEGVPKASRTGGSSVAHVVPSLFLDFHSSFAVDVVDLDVAAAAAFGAGLECATSAGLAERSSQDVVAADAAEGAVRHMEKDCPVVPWEEDIVVAEALHSTFAGSAATAKLARHTYCAVDRALKETRLTPENWTVVYGTRLEGTDATTFEPLPLCLEFLVL
jgi:hypothetical protein